MTEILTRETLDREFSRRAFVKGGGAMIVGFSLVGAAAGAKSASTAGVDPYASMGPFDQGLVDSWIVVNADNTITLKAGKIELGQGTPTGLMMIAAEELDVAMSQMKWTIHDTNTTTFPFSMATWAKDVVWSTSGSGAVFADPQFADPGAQDFRLKPGSPAAGMGAYETGAALNQWWKQGFPPEVQP